MSDDNVIDFAARSNGGVYEGLTCSCGSAWFTVQAVALDQDARITAWAAPLTCRDCGLVRVAGAWVRPDLTEASDLCDQCGMPESRCRTLPERKGVERCCDGCDHGGSDD